MSMIQSGIWLRRGNIAQTEFDRRKPSNVCRPLSGSTWPMNAQLISVGMLAAVLCLRSVVFAGEETKPRTDRPNVLFLAVDDLNDWVGCLGGHPQAKTPNIDRLARKGVLFEQAYCAAPLCHPSRTAIMTGLRPSTTQSTKTELRFRSTSASTDTLRGRAERFSIRHMENGRTPNRGTGSTQQRRALNGRPKKADIGTDFGTALPTRSWHV